MAEVIGYGIIYSEDEDCWYAEAFGAGGKDIPLPGGSAETASYDSMQECNIVTMRTLVAMFPGAYIVRADPA